MGRNKLFIKNTFEDYFDRLKEMAETVDHLKQLAREVKDQDVQNDIRCTIASLENEIKIYAENLRKGGMEISKRVA